MKRRLALVVAAVAALVGMAGAPASATGRVTPASPKATGHARVLPAAPATLYSQNNDDQGTATSSQNFEAAFDGFDDQAADDFTVPVGHGWKVASVAVTGVYFNGTGPAVSETVYIYKNKNGHPGVLVGSWTNTANDNNGSFNIKVPVGTAKPKLKAGHYWVSVVANMDFGTGGQWGWENRNTQAGSAAMWQNPGGAFGVCPVWGVMTTCVGGAGADLMFAITGTDVILA
jgi:hypothetical protein